MPNWCENEITITHEHLKVIRRFARAFKKRKLFNEFIPSPEELLKRPSPAPNDQITTKMIKKYGASDWYEWRVRNWGTKWDIGGADDNLDVVAPTKIKLDAWTAWSPPIAIFDHWVDIGCDVRAKYCEPGEGVKGTYKNKKMRAKDDDGNWKTTHSQYYRRLLDEVMCQISGDKTN